MVVVSIVTWSSTLKTTRCQNWQARVIKELGFGNNLTLARLSGAERAEVPIKPVIIPGRVHCNFSGRKLGQAAVDWPKKCITNPYCDY